MNKILRAARANVRVSAAQARDSGTTQFEVAV